MVALLSAQVSATATSKSSQGQKTQTSEASFSQVLQSLSGAQTATASQTQPASTVQDDGLMLREFGNIRIIDNGIETGSVVEEDGFGKLESIVKLLMELIQKMMNDQAGVGEFTEEDGKEMLNLLEQMQRQLQQLLDQNGQMVVGQELLIFLIQMSQQTDMSWIFTGTGEGQTEMPLLEALQSQVTQTGTDWLYQLAEGDPAQLLSMLTGMPQEVLAEYLPQKEPLIDTAQDQADMELISQQPLEEMPSPQPEVQPEQIFGQQAVQANQEAVTQAPQTQIQQPQVQNPQDAMAGNEQPVEAKAQAPAISMEQVTIASSGTAQGEAAQGEAAQDGTTQGGTAMGEAGTGNPEFAFQTAIRAVKEQMGKSTTQTTQTQKPAQDLESLQRQVDEGVFLRNTAFNTIQPMETPAEEPAPTLTHQVQDGILAGLRTGAEQFSIKLVPEGLGELTVKLTKTADGVMSLSIVAKQAETQSLLAAEIGTLRETLRPLQVQVSSILTEQQEMLLSQQEGFLHQHTKQDWREMHGAAYYGDEPLGSGQADAEEAIPPVFASSPSNVLDTYI